MANKQLEFEATVNASRVNTLLTQLRADAEGAAKAINDAFGGEVRKRILFEEVVDERGIKRLVAVEKERLSIADQIINRQKQLNKTQQGSLTSLRQQFNNLRQQRDGIVRYRDSVGSVGGLLKAQTAEWTAVNNQLSITARQLAVAEASGFWQQLKIATRAQGFINVLNGVEQIVQGLQAATIVIGQFQAAVNAVINSAAEVQSFALTFKAIGVGAAGGTAALQEASRIALGLGSDLRTVQDGFRQLSPVVLNIGGSMNDVSAITETLSSRFAAFGISGDRARRVMNGVIQAFAKGKLQAEELTQQISEADPAFKTDFAKALFESRSELGKLGKQVDGTVGNLEKLVKAGAITGDVLLRVLPGLSKSSLLFGKLGPSAATALAALERGNVTIDQVRANLKTLNELSLRNFAESAQPLINAFLRVQAVVTDFFTRISKSQGLESLAKLGATAFEVFAGLADSLLTVAEGVVVVIGAFKPLIDLFTAFPGLLQAVGLGVIGNLISPLGLFERRIGKTKAAWASFAGFFRNALSPAKQEIELVTNRIGTIENTLTKTLGKTVKPTAITSIASSTEKAIASVEGVGGQTVDQIDASINRTKARIAELKGQLAETADQKIGTESPAGRSESTLTALIAQNEAKVNELQSSAETIRQENAGIVSRTAIDINQLNKAIDESVDGLSKFGKIRESALKYQPKPSIERGAPAAFSGFPEKSLKSYAQNITEKIAAINKAVASGSLEELGAVAGENLLGKTQKQIDDFVSRFTSSTKTLKAQLVNLQAEFQSRGIDFSIDVIGEQRVNSDLQSIENQIRSLQNETRLAKAELASLSGAVASDLGKNSFSENETKRQKKLRAQIEESQNQLQNLYAEQARQKQSGIQVRRQQAGFDPASIASEKKQFQQLIDIQKQASQQEFLGKANTRLEAIARQRTRILNELAKIEENRARDIATFGEQAYSQGYRTDEIDRLRSSLDALDNSQNRIFTSAQKYANEQNNIGKILAEGAAEGATYEQRQLAISAALKLTNTSLQQQGKLLNDATNRLTQLKEERKALISQQMARGFTGAPQADDPVVANLRANKEEIKATNNEILNLQNNIQETGNVQSQLTKLQDQNTKTVSKQASGFRRLAGIVVDPLVGSFRLAGNGIKSLLNGLKGLAGLIDPLTAIFIAAGVASRLYADGNKDAAEVAKRYGDQLQILNQAQSELVPGQQAATSQASVLARAWDGLAAATVRFADAAKSAFSGVFSEIGFFVEGIKNGLKSAGEGVSAFGNIIGSVGLTSGFVALGAFIGSLFGPGPGTAIGAAIGAVVGVISSLAIGTDQATVALDKLQKKLDEVEKGSKETTLAVESLALGLVNDIKVPKAGGLAEDDIRRLKSGTEAIKQSVKAAKDELSQTRGLRIANEKEREKQKASIESLVEAEKKAIEKRNRLESEVDKKYVRTGAVTRAIAAQTPEGRALAEAENELRKIQKALNDANGASKSYNDQNAELGDTERKLVEDLKRKEAALALVQKRLTRAAEENIKYANTTNEIQEAIKTLQGENADIDLTDKEGLKKLDLNLQKIKQLQKVLEIVGKTRYEINLELKDIRGEIAQAQTVIDFPPGPLREVYTIAREVSDEIDKAGEQFNEDMRDAAKLQEQGLKGSQVAQDIINKATETYARSVTTGASKLIEAGRAFRDQLNDAKNSLTNLKLSNPQFFTPQELQANAKEIETTFVETLNRVREETGNYNWFPPGALQGTLEDQLQFKANFNSTRTEAQKLAETINDISSSLDTIIGLITNLNAEGVKNLKKYGIDINAIIERSRTKLEGMAGAAGRVGEVVANISGGGQDLVLYFDNITGQIEQVTAAEFKARQEADRLAKSGGKIAGGFEGGASTAVSAISGIGTEASNIVGQISAGGKTITLYNDQLIGKNEALNGLASGRLATEKKITEENGNQLDRLDKAIKLFRSPAARRPGASPTGSGAAGFVDLSKVLGDQQGDQQLAARASELGGNFLRVFSDTIARGGVGAGSFPLGKLEAVQAGVTDYKVAVETAAIAQDQLTQAQARYNQAIAAGQQDTASLAAGVQNAKSALAGANLELESAQIKYAAAARLAGELGVSIDSIPPFGQFLEGTGAQPTLDQWGQLIEDIQKVGPQLQRQSLDPLQPAVSSAQAFIDELQNTGAALANGQAPAENIAGSFGDAAGSVEAITNSLSALTQKVFDVRVSTIPARWAGGPVTAGGTYQVNELGKEGFLSSTGQLSPINTPANALWRAPGSGTVIPADIWSKIDAPNGKITASKALTNMKGIGSQGEQLASIVRQVNNALIASQSNDELAMVQAQQAIEIGKLSSSVEKLAAKKWNVQVNVSPKGDISYLNRMNHRL